MDDFVYQTKIKVRNCKVKPCFIGYSVGAKPCFQSFYRSIVPPFSSWNIVPPIPPWIIVPTWSIFPPVSLEYCSPSPHPMEYPPGLLFPPGLIFPLFHPQSICSTSPFPLQYPPLEYCSPLLYPRRDAFSLTNKFAGTNHLYFAEMQNCESNDSGTLPQNIVHHPLPNENPGVSIKLKYAAELSRV